MLAGKWEVNGRRNRADLQPLPGSAGDIENAMVRRSIGRDWAEHSQGFCFCLLRPWHNRWAGGDKVCGLGRCSAFALRAGGNKQGAEVEDCRRCPFCFPGGYQGHTENEYDCLYIWTGNGSLSVGDWGVKSMLHGGNAGVKCQPGSGWKAVKLCRFVYKSDGQYYVNAQG